MHRLSPRLPCLLARLLCGVFVTAAVAAAHAATAAQKNHGDHATQCRQWSAWLACDVSWYRLLADPAAYDDRIVRIDGYLVSDFGDLILYPDETSYRGGRETESLLLARPFSIPADIIDQLGVGKGVYPVTVLGRFGRVPRDASLGIQRAGALREIKKILVMPKVPSGTPLDMRGITVEGRSASSP